MRAAVLHEPNAPLTIEELSVPPLGHGQVGVRLRASGVCHTQLLEVRGQRGVDRYLPHTLGHEGAGVVDAVGPGVTRVAAGDHVVVSWIRGAGLDAPPPLYTSGGRRINAGPVTTFQEYAVVPENRVTRVAPELPLDHAALIGCAVATGAGAVINTARVEPGSTVVVFGAGGVGLCAVQAAALAGATRVVAVDVAPEKLDLARRLGATDTVDTTREDPVDAVLKRTGGAGADYAIEAAGRRETMEQAHRAVRTGGGLAVLVGNLPAGGQIAIDPFALIAGRRLVGTWGGETRPERDFPRYVALALAGRLKLDELITHRFRLDDVNGALDVLACGRASRVILEL